MVAEARMDFNPEQCRNETEVESKFLIRYLLPALGYSPDAWFQEVALGQIRLDLMAFAAQVMPFSAWGSPPIRLILEAKHPERNLDAHARQLRHYLSTLEVRHGLLTNGREVRLYEWHAGQFREVLRCRGRETPAHLPTLQTLVGRSPTDTPEESAMSVVPPREAEASAPAPRPPAPPTPSEKKESAMKTIAIYHNKGGVGKTTTVVNLAAALAKRGLRVLVVDLDSQANTTFAMGLAAFEDEAQDDLADCHVGHMLFQLDSSFVEDVARKSRFSEPAIDVVPSHISLMGMEAPLNARSSAPISLMKKLQLVQHRYDVVLIDTPPSLNLFARVALIAADYLIIPSDLKPFANQGLLNVQALIKDVNDLRSIASKEPLEVVGVLPTKISTNSSFVKASLPRRRQTVTERYGVPVMASTIFEREDAAKCTEQLQTVNGAEVPAPRSVLDYKPQSTSAEEFRALADEVVAATGLRVAEVAR
jgi:cellulose biosynthesis protein BcsQ